jgi:hypothetical protein
VNRSLVPAAALVALLLAGCPLPQPLPDYEAATVTPPRILEKSVQVTGPTGVLTKVGGVYLIPADCVYVEPGPSYALDLQIVDPNNTEIVPARWFIDYTLGNDSTTSPRRQDFVPPNEDEADLARTVPTFTFRPYRDCPDGAPPCAVEGDLRVVEIVISNANGFFQPAGDETEPLPWRSPAEGFETQVYPFSFQLVAGIEGCP